MLEGEWTAPILRKEDTNYDEQKVQARRAQAARKQELKELETREYHKRLNAAQTEKAKNKNMSDANATPKWLLDTMRSPFTSTTGVFTPLAFASTTCMYCCYCCYYS